MPNGSADGRRIEAVAISRVNPDCAPSLRNEPRTIGKSCCPLDLTLCGGSSSWFCNLPTTLTWGTSAGNNCLSISKAAASFPTPDCSPSAPSNGPCASSPTSRPCCLTHARPCSSSTRSRPSSLRRSTPCSPAIPTITTPTNCVTTPYSRSSPTSPPPVTTAWPRDRPWHASSTPTPGARPNSPPRNATSCSRS